MKRAVVLGAGRVGSAMAVDLAGDAAVTVVDADAAALSRMATRIEKAGVSVAARQADLGDPRAVAGVVDGADVVLGALSSRLGMQTLRAVVEAGKRYVDISFMAEDALALDALAREKGACVVVDCGVAPGVSNLLAGHAARVLSPCESIEIFVGGLPVERTWPFEYKAGFAPFDVIEEYVRPARLVQGGKVVVKEALSEPERIDFAGVGTLEAFNTDGLRSLTTTLAVPDMREKTLRYPGHAELMRVLRATGLFDTEPVDVKGAKVVPRDVAAALLFPRWSFAPGEADLTVLRVAAVGENENGVRVRMCWDMLDRYDADAGMHAMARTTAFPATAVARRMLAGQVTAPGVVAPEALAADTAVVDAVLKDLERRGIRITLTVAELP